MVEGICAAMHDAESDPAVRAVIITGAGSAFCAGAELDTLLSAADGDFAPVAEVYTAFLRVLNSPLLTIAAVNGAAVGAGMNLALSCDLRLAGPRARFDARFAQLRLHPGGGHMWLLQRAVGYQRAALSCLLSRTWDAREAAQVGLVLEVVPEDVVAHSVALGSGMADLEQDFSRAMVASFRSSATLVDHGSALEMETTAQQWSTSLPGFVTGVEAIKARIASS